LEKLLETITYSPRKLLGLQIPVLKKGEKATLTLFDPVKRWQFDDKTNKSKSRNSPYFGMAMVGKTVAVFNNGKALLDKDLKSK
jgi:dihydroorotase